MAKKNRAAQREALRKRMKAGMNKGGGDSFENKSIFKSGLEGIKFWNPKSSDNQNLEAGKHWFDIIPYLAGSNDPDVDKGEETYCFQPYMHYGIGPNEKSVICLAKTYGKPCPICEHVKKLLSQGADEDLIKSIQAQRHPRAIYNVIVLDNKEEIKKGVQIFHTSHFLIEGPLLELANKPLRPGSKQVESFVYYADPDEGKTIYFVKKKKGDFFDYDALSFEDREDPINDKILKQAHTLDELVHIPTYGEAEAILNGEEDPDSEKEEDAKPKRELKSREEKVEPELEEGARSLEQQLKEMNRADLKVYIKENDVDIVVKRGMTEDDIVESIMEEIESTEPDNTEDEGLSCEHGTFGEDTDKLRQCEECDEDKWKACVKASD